MRLPLILALLALVPVPASAKCACLCVDGARKALCTTPAELGEHPGLCTALAARGCPEPPQTAAPRERYAAPLGGVANCRDVQVYDASSDGYVSARVCDTLPGGAGDGRSG